MDIKPLYNTQTIKFKTKIGSEVKLSTKIQSDPVGQIPNGVFRIIKWEFFRQLISIIISSLTVFASLIMIILYSTVLHAGWASYILPLIIFMIASWKLFSSLIERKSLTKNVNRYREDLKLDISSTPPFLTKLYKGFHIKQVAHNWITFASLFYGGIFTLLLWWLKDLHWWFFEFDKWIHELFASPSVLIWIFTIFLLSTLAIHIYFAIQRKKRIIELDAYFGSSIAPIAELETSKAARNKFFRRLFIISLMVILIIPILIRISLKLLRRK